MKFCGQVWKYGDNVDTDAIIPARYLNTSAAEELARHCMEDIDPSFARSVRSGDVIVAGENFGCGSSREHAPLAIKGAGISCVVARSFARIFYRNAINIGLPILESSQAVAHAATSHRLEIDLESGQIRNLTTGEDYQAKPYPRFMRELLAIGGLIPYTRQRIKDGRLPSVRVNTPQGRSGTETTKTSKGGAIRDHASSGKDLV